MQTRALYNSRRDGWAMCLANFEVGASGEFLNDEMFDSEESKNKCNGEMFRVVGGKWNRSGWYQMLHGFFF